MIPSAEKPIILLAFGEATQRPNLRAEATELGDIFQQSELGRLCEVVERQNASIAELFDLCQNPDFWRRLAIFHFGGHAQSGAAFLEPLNGGGDQGAALPFSQFLGRQTGFQLFFVNSCASPELIAALRAPGKVVIGTAPLIDEQIAVEFCSRFYRSLVSGSPIRTAYYEAEAAIQMAHGRDERRTLYQADAPLKDHLPWNLYLRPGAEYNAKWSLAEAVDNPLFGLPVLPDQPLPEQPFRHLRWFRCEDAELFFGRGFQIRELFDKVTAPRTAPIILFYGQSGVGKSSLLEAGLLPRLEGDYAIHYLRRQPELGLRATLAALFPEAKEPATSINQAWRNLEAELDKPLIIILDQVEEAYTHLPSDSDREVANFIEALDTLFGPPAPPLRGKLVLGFRQEWLADIETRLKERKLFHAKVLLENLDRRSTIEAITGVSRSPRLQQHYGVTIDPNLPEVIADDLLADRQAVIAPTLQILLTKMWDRTTETQAAPHFSLDLYQSLKKEGLLLEDFVDQQLAALAKQHPEAVNAGLALDILMFHTTPLGTSAKRSTEQFSESYPHQEASDLVRACKRLYLLSQTFAGQGQPSTTQLAHDALTPLIRRRFRESDRPGQRARLILETAMREWQGQARGTLLDKQSLALVEQGQPGMRALTPQEEALIQKTREIITPPKLEENLFPDGLAVLEFIPDEKLDISARAYTKLKRLGWFIWGILWLIIGTILLAGLIVGRVTGGAGLNHVRNALNSLKVAFKGEAVLFDFKAKLARKRSRSDELRSSQVSYEIKNKRRGKVGQLIVDEQVFYKTKPLPSKKAVKEQIIPFWRALNFALDYDVIDEDIAEES